MSGIPLVLACLLLLAPAVSTAPDAVWAGFDPRREPLEIETVKRWNEHGARYIEFTFTRLGGWVTQSPATDPIPPVPSLLRSSAGPDGKTGITTTAAIPILTHMVGDPKWRGPNGASLHFEIYVRTPHVLTVVMHEDEFATRWTQFRKTLRLEPAETWQTLTFSANDFLADKGEPLKNWQAVTMLELRSQGGPGSEPVFRAFRWVERPQR